MSKKLLNLTILVALVLAMVPGAALAAPVLQEEGESYVIQKADWLSKLAEKYLGNVDAWPAIVVATNMKAEEDPSFAMIDDPDVIEPGWKIWIPGAEEAQALLAEYEPVAEADLLDEVMGAGKIVISTDPNYAPQSFLNEAGELDGFDIDVSKEVAKRLGVEVEFVTPDWDLITAGKWGGRWDLSIGSMTITEPRMEVLWFTDPYYYTPASFAVHTDNTSVAAPQDLAGKKVCVGSATTYEDYLNDQLAMVGEKEIYKVEGVVVDVRSTDAECIQDLALGDGVRLDGVMSALPTLNNAIKEGVAIKIVGDPAFYERLAFSLDKSRGPSDKMVAKLNEVLAAMHSDGTLTDLSMKWYEADLTKKVGAPEEEAAGPLIIGTTDKVTDLDPAETYDFHTWEIFYNVGGTLLTYVPGTTELKPMLAAEMPTVSDDGLEWTFKLRPGMKFPDGTPLDATAVKWSLDRVVRLEGDPNWLVSSFLDEATVVDDLTITIKLQNKVGFFPYLTAIPPWTPVSPNCYSEDGFDSDSTCSGLGPYKITRWERDVEMELEANPDFPGDPPKWPSVIVRYFADATTMRLALENGEIDVAWKTLLPTDYVDLEENPNVTVIEGPGAFIHYICFNSTTPPFDNAMVRQAISLAIDRDEITDRVYLGTHQPLYSMVPIGMAGHVDAFPKRDLDGAKLLLADAGYSEESPLEMDFWWTPTHYGDTEADLATVMKANLEETGMIKVNLQSAEWATYTDYFGPGTMPVFLLGWYPDYIDPDNYTWSFAHSEAADDLGLFYASEEMDALLEAAQTETDMATRLDLYKQIQELWTIECPTIPFSQGSLYVVTQNNVTGVTLAPYMLFPYFLLEK
jgi:peptide/nickel transport system substrate-binding protein